MHIKLQSEHTDIDYEWMSAINSYDDKKYFKDDDEYYLFGSIDV